LRQIHEQAPARSNNEDKSGHMMHTKTPCIDWADTHSSELRRTHQAQTNRRSIDEWHLRNLKWNFELENVEPLREVENVPFSPLSIKDNYNIAEPSISSKKRYWQFQYEQRGSPGPAIAGEIHSSVSIGSVLMASTKKKRERDNLPSLILGTSST
jgi:hypothetical protein